MQCFYSSSKWHLSSSRTITQHANDRRQMLSKNSKISVAQAVSLFILYYFHILVYSVFQIIAFTGWDIFVYWQSVECVAKDSPLKVAVSFSLHSRLRACLFASLSVSLPVIARNHGLKELCDERQQTKIAESLTARTAVGTMAERASQCSPRRHHYME